MIPMHFQIRDPIHGVITLSGGERAVVDSFVFQRLRNIKQVGFLDFAFPGASHSRYSHSLGAMHVASRIFTRVIADDLGLEGKRLHQALRLAALLHDVGHPPLSHTTEMVMPNLLGQFMQATHEDYTRRLILDSELTELIATQFKDVGVTPGMVASLLDPSDEHEEFLVNGLNYGPILRQIISSEIDADRMDYLQRDSFFCGVNYGKFDSDWLIDNLVSVKRDSSIYLGLKARAIFAFEDFLLSRYHMFASVYFHHTPVIMEKMLERFFIDCPDSFRLPHDLSAYIELNDMDLWQALRHSRNQWAERIVRKRPYVMLYESIKGLTKDRDEHASKLIESILKEASIEVICSRSKPVLSKYFNKVKDNMYVEDNYQQMIPLEDFSPLFIRYQAPIELIRIYVDPDQQLKAEQLVQKFRGDIFP